MEGHYRTGREMSVFSVFSQGIYLETARPLSLLAVFSASSVFRENRVSKKNTSRKNLGSFLWGIFIPANLSKNTQDTRDTKDTVDFKGFFLCAFGDTLEALKTIGQLKIYVSAMTYA